MAYIFIHGLGQTPESWDQVISNMSLTEEVLCPNLPALITEQECNYKNLYAVFCRYCETESGKINLCGLSLGGILALNYAIDHPKKIKSLVLIGTQYVLSLIHISEDRQVPGSLLPHRHGHFYGGFANDVLHFGRSPQRHAIDFPSGCTLYSADDKGKGGAQMCIRDRSYQSNRQYGRALLCQGNYFRGYGSYHSRQYAGE